MPEPISDAMHWLAAYLASGDSTPESRVFRAARQAGYDHRDIRHAARALGVEVKPYGVVAPSEPVQRLCAPTGAYTGLDHRGAWAGACRSGRAGLKRDETMSYQDDGMVWHRERSSYADRQRLAHMRAQSDALLAARPELAGPYRVPPPAKVVAEAVAYVLPVPAESAAEKAK